MRIAFATVGCRLNQFETDALRGQAQGAAHEIVPFDANADVYVINTCTITAEADADSRQLARRAIRRNPAALVVVTGCYAQAAPEAVAAIPGVDLVVGNRDKANLLAVIQDSRKDGTARVRVPDISTVPRVDGDAYGPAVDPGRTRAFLKVQDGCNYGCSFCIVPRVRGPNRSQSPARVIQAIRRLHAEGFPEVVLTGVHLGTYGRDLQARATLADLCAAIAELPASPRVRLSSLDPHEVTPALTRILRDSPRFCRHLHLPFQSADERVLRRMRRGHTAAAFRALVDDLTAAVPGIAVTGDVMVGFPGEDATAFQTTYDALEELPLAGLHVFSYSRRPGTDAAGYPDQVSSEVKTTRSRALRVLAAQKAHAFRQRTLGKTLEVVVLRQDDASGLLEGLSDNYVRVWFAGDAAVRGSVVGVRVEQVTGRGVIGSVVNASGRAALPPTHAPAHAGVSVDTQKTVQ